MSAAIMFTLRKLCVVQHDVRDISNTLAGNIVGHMTQYIEEQTAARPATRGSPSTSSRTSSGSCTSGRRTSGSRRTSVVTSTPAIAASDPTLRKELFGGASTVRPQPAARRGRTGRVAFGSSPCLGSTLGPSQGARRSSFAALPTIVSRPRSRRDIGSSSQTRVQNIMPRMAPTLRGGSSLGLISDTSLFGESFKESRPHGLADPIVAKLVSEPTPPRICPRCSGVMMNFHSTERSNVDMKVCACEMIDEDV
jgi:hypothetical protein